MLFSPSPLPDTALLIVAIPEPIVNEERTSTGPADAFGLVRR